MLESQWLILSWLRFPMVNDLKNSLHICGAVRLWGMSSGNGNSPLSRGYVLTFVQILCPRCLEKLAEMLQ